MQLSRQVRNKFTPTKSVLKKLSFFFFPCCSTFKIHRFTFIALFCPHFPFRNGWRRVTWVRPTCPFTPGDAQKLHSK